MSERMTGSMGSRATSRAIKMPVQRLLQLMLLLMIPSIAAAQKPAAHPIDKTLDACMEKNQSTAGMSQCLVQADEMWDKELNRVYGELARRLSPAGRQTLKETQRQWLLHRDAEFKLIADLYAVFEGTMYIPMQADSRMQVVKKRTLELTQYLNLLKEHKP